jgi:hypothetical protein
MHGECCERECLERGEARCWASPDPLTPGEAPPDLAPLVEAVDRAEARVRETIKLHPDIAHPERVAARQERRVARERLWAAEDRVDRLKLLAGMQATQATQPLMQYEMICESVDLGLNPRLMPVGAQALREKAKTAHFSPTGRATADREVRWYMHRERMKWAAHNGIEALVKLAYRAAFLFWAVGPADCYWSDAARDSVTTAATTARMTLWPDGARMVVARYAAFNALRPLIRRAARESLAIRTAEGRAAAGAWIKVGLLFHKVERQLPAWDTARNAEQPPADFEPLAES